jgi:hypothetical protein
MSKCKRVLSACLTFAMIFQWFIAPVALAADNSGTIKTNDIDIHSLTIPTPNMTPISDYSNFTISVRPAVKTEGYPLCGGKGQKPCGDKPATFSSAAVGKCPKGSFFDIGKWACYACPSGYSRSLASIDDYKACQKKRAKPKLLGTFTKAEKLGTVCPSGSFIDPIRGGECWKCPSNYNRTIFHVEANNACQKGGILGPVAKASKVKKAGCNDGEIKDGIGGNGGSCWTCPKGNDRTIFPINGNKACEKSEWFDFKDVVKKADLTCPAGEIFDFTGLTGQDIKTRPEFKGGKKPKEITSGTCWTCPQGYDRTTDSVKSNNACRAKFMVWQPGTFVNPGLFGFADKGLVEKVLMNIVKRSPDLVASALNEAAKQVAKDNKKSANSVLAFETKNLENTPEVSTVAAGLVMRRIMAVIADESKATADEKKLAEAFGKYIQARRTHIAKEAIAAYEAWKLADAEERSKRNKNNLVGLIDYGTVPPDFGAVVTGSLIGNEANAAIGTAAGIAAGSIPVIGVVLGDLVSMGTGATLNGFGDFSSVDSAVGYGVRNAVEIAIGKALELAIEKMVKSAVAEVGKQVMTTQLAAGAISSTAQNLAKEAATRTLSSLGGSGPAIIIAIEGMVLSIAIDQFIEISEAKGRLDTALVTAKRTVSFSNLARIAKTPQGISELLGYWGYLIAGDTKPNSAFLKDWKVGVETALKPETAKKTSTTAKASGTKASGAKSAPKWQQLTGYASDIGAGAPGLAAIVSQKDQVYVLDSNKNKVAKQKLHFKRIDMNAKGAIVGVNAKGEIWTSYKGKTVQLPGQALDVGIGQNGSIWVIGTKSIKGGFEIYRWQKNKFVKVPGAAIRIDVDPKGNAWVVSGNKGDVYSFNGKKWVKNTKAPAAKDIAVGGDGTVYILDEAGSPYKETKGGWTKLPGKAANITVDDEGIPIVSTDQNTIYKLIK